MYQKFHIDKSPVLAPLKKCHHLEGLNNNNNNNLYLPMPFPCAIRRKIGVSRLDLLQVFGGGGRGGYCKIQNLFDIYLALL